jgi:hypothetical protein
MCANPRFQVTPVCASSTRQSLRALTWDSGLLLRAPHQPGNPRMCHASHVCYTLKPVFMFCVCMPRLGSGPAMHLPCVSHCHSPLQLLSHPPPGLPLGCATWPLAALQAIHARATRHPLLISFPFAAHHGVDIGLPAHTTYYLPNLASNICSLFPVKRGVLETFYSHTSIATFKWFNLFPLWARQT